MVNRLSTDVCHTKLEYNLFVDNVKCEFCRKFFKKKRSQIKLSNCNYCSRLCASSARRKGKMVKCDECGIEIYKTLKSLRLSKQKKYFCSWNCSNAWFGRKSRGDRHPNWSGGNSSYKNILIRSNLDPKCRLCSIKNLKVLLAHHVDKNRKNNNISNLCWLCCNCHFLVHHYKNVGEILLSKLKNGKR